MVEDDQHDGHGADPRVMIFGDHDHVDEQDQEQPATARSQRTARRRARRARTRRRRSTVVLVLLLALLLVAGVLGWRSLGGRFAAKDYTGTGTGSVLVRVKDGDDAGAIGQTLHDADVVASVRAFTNAADADDRSRGIQPGAYELRHRMSASAALGLLLDPSARVSKRVVLPEGVTVLDVEQRVAQALGVPVADVKAAAANVAGLGLPVSYTTGRAAPSSGEGFFWPDTYSFDPGTGPEDALATMVSAFAGQDRQLGFSQDAEANGLTPYNALIIASIIEGEAKFDDDRPKVARVILNRLAAGRPLQIDATSVYGAKIAGLDPAKVRFETLDSPYNSYTHPGLPPTPIDSPGAASLKAAADPAAGDWQWYVNIDAQGHLGFFDDENAFAAAAKTCAQNGWGCAG